MRISRVPERMAERAGYICLDRNERVEPFPKEIEEEIRERVSAALLCGYPDPSPIYRRLSRGLGYPENWIYVTPGSDAAIRMIFQAFVAPGDRVVFAVPSYAMYEIYTGIADGIADAVPYDSDRCLDLNRLFGALQNRPKLLTLANPDQPTGSVLSQSSLQDVIARATEVGALVVIDEAYYPFHPETVIELVREFNNLVVTRSFSKAQGLAGLRLGYMVADPHVISYVQQIRGAHEVNAMAVAAGAYVLDHPELAKGYVEDVEAGRRVLAESAKRLGLGFPSCPTNFQLLCFPDGTDIEEVLRGLKGKGYLVKGSFSSPVIRNCLRVTLGSPSIIQGFVKALEAVVAEQGCVL